MSGDKLAREARGGGKLVVHNNHLTLNGIQYFRGGAESVFLGSYGEKKTPLFGQNYLEVQGDIPPAQLAVIGTTTVDIGFTKTTAADLKVNLSVAGGYSGSVDTAVNDLKQGTLKLVKFEMRLADVLSAINATPNLAGTLKKYGNDARVAHHMFVIMSATLAHTFTTATRTTFSKSGGRLQIAANGGVSTSGSSSVTLSPGTTFAYLLCKADWNRGKSAIDKMVDDQWRIG